MLGHAQAARVPWTRAPWRVSEVPCAARAIAVPSRMASDPIDPWSVLAPAQAEVARRWLVERERERRHLVIYLSGAHAYGFPSPDSDLDLKCVHIAPTAELVGLSPVD